MGIYDREYVREEPRGFSLGGERTMVTNLILANVAVFVAQHLFEGLTGALELHADLLRQPWRIYELLTYGFLHGNWQHLFFNMLAFWFFARDIETIYGRKELLRIYLTL